MIICCALNWFVAASQCRFPCWNACIDLEGVCVCVLPGKTINDLSRAPGCTRARKRPWINTFAFYIPHKVMYSVALGSMFCLLENPCGFFKVLKPSCSNLAANNIIL